MANPPLRTAISDTYPNPSNATARAGLGALYDYATSFPFAHNRLVKSGANIVLTRFQGLWLPINDKVYAIPSAGVSLAPTGLSANTRYYVYAYMSGATMTLEASTTSHSTDAATGVEIKTGDATRTLVGMVFTTTGPAFLDTTNNRCVVSWQNRRPLQCQAGLGGSVAITSTTAVELTTALRLGILLWADECAQFTFDGYASNSAVGASVVSYLSVDGTILEGFSAFLNTGAGQIGPVSVTSPVGVSVNGLAEGFHYITPFVNVNTGTGTWVGSGSPGGRCSVKGWIRG